MSTEDIRFRITADEAGAVNAFKRFRSEVLNNEKQLERVGKQGKMTSTALKDAANVLGPEFQILGDRIDHLSGSLADFQSAGIAAKASFVALVAVSGFEIGQTIGNWVFETERWKEELEAARQEAERIDNLLTQKALEISVDMSAEEIEREIEGIRSNMLGLKKQINDINAAWYDFYSADFYSKGALETELKGLQERLAVFKEELKAREKMQQEIDAQNTPEKRMEALAELMKPQYEYLDSLELEILKLKEGEEAYERARLSRLGYSQMNIDEAIRLQKEIKELNRLESERQSKPPTQVQRQQVAQRFSEIRGEEQRFITRGIGPRTSEQMLETAKQQSKVQQDTLAELKQQRRLLEQRLPKEVV